MTKANSEQLAGLQVKINNYSDVYMNDGTHFDHAQYLSVDDEALIGLFLMDKGDDVGTYQFYFEDGQIVVADYFDRDQVYGKHDEDTFNTQYDVGLSFENITYIFTALEEYNAKAYLSVESRMITHRELMDRKGWYDRRIKKYFPDARPDELDRVKYYPLDKILKIEETI